MLSALSWCCCPSLENAQNCQHWAGAAFPRGLVMLWLRLAESVCVFHGLSYGGAKARMVALHFEIFESAVRWLCTTHRKLSLSDSTVCAFAPRQKRPRPDGSWRGALRDHILQDARYVIDTITFFCSFVSWKFPLFSEKIANFSRIFQEKYCTFWIF